MMVLLDGKKSFFILFLINLVINQDNLLPLNNCLGNCAICANDEPSTCSGLEFIQCVKGYQGNGCQAKSTYLSEIVVQDWTKQDIVKGIWTQESITKCVFKNSKKQDKNVFVLGLYSQFDLNEAEIQIQPYYQNYIISFNLIRGSWTPYSDLLRFAILDQEDQILNEQYIQFPRREDINPKKHLLRCKNQPLIIEKYQVQGKLDPKKHNKIILKFQGMMFSDAKWGLSNVKILFGCAKFLKFDEVDCRACSDGYFQVLDVRGDISGCQLCPMSCKTCTEATVCQTCLEGYNLKDNKCQNNNAFTNFSSSVKSLKCSNSSFQLSNSNSNQETLTFVSQFLPSHKKIRLIFNLAIEPQLNDKLISKDIINLFIEGVNVKNITYKEIQLSGNKAVCKGFGKDGYYTTIKIVLPYLIHQRQKVTLDFKRNLNRKFGIQQVFVQFQKKQEKRQQPKKQQKKENTSSNIIPNKQKKQANLQTEKPQKSSLNPASPESIKNTQQKKISQSQNQTPVQNKSLQIIKPKQDPKIIQKPYINQSNSKPKNQVLQSPKLQNKTINEPPSKVQAKNDSKPMNSSKIQQIKPKIQDLKSKVDEAKNKIQQTVKKNTDQVIDVNSLKKQVVKIPQIIKPIDQSIKNLQTVKLPQAIKSLPQKIILDVLPKPESIINSTNIIPKPLNPQIYIPPTIPSIFNFRSVMSQSINKLSQNKWNTKFMLKPGRELIIIIIFPIQVQHYPFIIAHFVHQNLTLVPQIKEITSQEQQLKFNIKRSLLDQVVQIYMSDHPQTSIKGRYLAQTEQVLSLGLTSIKRYDYLTQEEWASIQKYSVVFQIFAWFAIISTIALSFMGISVLTQKFSILLQIIFLHVYVYADYLPINFKHIISGLQRIQNLNYFLSGASEKIQKILLGNVVQVSPIKFTQFNIDINFIRGIYPCIIINFLYLIWFFVFNLFKNKLRLQKNNFSKIRQFFINLAERWLNFWYQIWQYQYIVFIWSACIQFYNIAYPLDSDRSSVPNTIFCIACFIIVNVMPVGAFFYLRRKFYKMDYYEYGYFYQNIFFENLTTDQLPSSSHRIYILVRNLRYLLLVISFAFLGNLPVPAIIVIILTHVCSIVFLKLTDVKVNKTDEILSIIEHVLLIALALAILIAFETSVYLQTNHYMVVGHIISVISLLAILNGLIRIVYYCYQKCNENTTRVKGSIEIRVEEYAYQS